MSEPTQASIAAAFEYDAARGLLIWKSRPRAEFATGNAWAVWNTKHSGTVAGWISVKGYRTIRFAGKCRKASRLIWVLLNGVEPDRVDHIDGDTTNDRAGNLRDVSQGENSRNRARGRNNHSGASGVYIEKGSWRAQINARGVRHYLGTFPTREAAIEARQAAERAHGFHPNHGRDAA